jgi:hypothetical protein
MVGEGNNFNAFERTFFINGCKGKETINHAKGNNDER